MPLGRNAWKHDPQIMRMEHRRKAIENMPDGPEKEKAQKKRMLNLKINLWMLTIVAFLGFVSMIGFIVVGFLECTGLTNIFK